MENKISQAVVENKIRSGKRNIRNASGKQNQSNKKSTASGKQKLYFTIRLHLVQQFVHLHNTKQKHKMLKDYHFIIEQSGLTLELESFENDGIALELYFGSGKSITFDIYDCLTEKFSDHYRTICATLDPFIIEQLETEIKKCFTK